MKTNILNTFVDTLEMSNKIYTLEKHKINTRNLYNKLKQSINYTLITKNIYNTYKLYTHDINNTVYLNKIQEETHN